MSKRTPARAAILDATKRLLWERGYEATSPRDVLEASGAGQGSLYHHFSGKLALAVTALEEVAAEEMAAVDAIFAADDPPLDRVRAYLKRTRHPLRGCRLGRMASEPAIEQAAFRAPIAAFVGHVERRLTDCLVEAAGKGQLRPGIDPSAVATALLALVEGGYVLARAHWDEKRMAQAIEGGLALVDAISA